MIPKERKGDTLNQSTAIVDEEKKVGLTSLAFIYKLIYSQKESNEGLKKVNHLTISRSKGNLRESDARISHKTYSMNI